MSSKPPRKAATPTSKAKKDPSAAAAKEGTGPAGVDTRPRNRDAVTVVAKFRPQNDRERRENGFIVCEFEENGTTVTLDPRNVPGWDHRSEGSEYRFTFDAVFSPAASQSDLYDATSRSLIDDVLSGYYATIFSYGQTGAGKTYSMEGPMEKRDETNEGIIPRAVKQIFDAAEDYPEDVQVSVKVSYVEIYQERITCLLEAVPKGKAPTKTNLDIRVDLAKGVYVEGATEVAVQSDSELLKVLQRGSDRRHTGATSMNADSSRSHACMMITVVQKDMSDLTARTGKLFLVDLAGSEMTSKTGAEGQRLEEAKRINKSLSALGLVIKALTSKDSNYVPYRDSKLTRILQDSLGGSSRACLIVACSPSSYNLSETISTLRFGTRAKYIRNRPKVHVGYGGTRLEEMLQKRDLQLEQMREELAVLQAERGRLVADNERYCAEFGALGEAGAGGGAGGVDRAGLAEVVEGYQEQLVRLRHELAAIAREALLIREASAEVDLHLREERILFTKVGTEMARVFRVWEEERDGLTEGARQVERVLGEMLTMGRWRNEEMVRKMAPLGRAALAVREAAEAAEADVGKRADELSTRAEGAGGGGGAGGVGEERKPKKKSTKK